MASEYAKRLPPELRALVRSFREQLDEQSRSAAGALVGAEIKALTRHYPQAVSEALAARKLTANFPVPMDAARELGAAWMVFVTRGTAAAYDYLLDAQPVIVSPEQTRAIGASIDEKLLSSFELLSGEEVRDKIIEAHSQALLELYSSIDKLPWPLTFIDFDLPLSECPIVAPEVAARDSERRMPARLGGILFENATPGILRVYPFVAFHVDSPDELSCPCVLTLVRSRRKGALPPLEIWEVCATLVPDDDVLSVDRLALKHAAIDVSDTPEGRTDPNIQSMISNLFLSLNSAPWAATSLQLLNAANVTYAPTPRITRQIRRRLERKKSRAKIPLVVTVRKERRLREGGAAGVTGRRRYRYQFDVRGHFAYFRRGPIFERHPEKRRWIRGIGWAVPVWRPMHIKGPPGAPYVPRVRRV